MKLFKKIYGKKNYYYANALKNLCITWKKLYKYDINKKGIQHALEIIEKIYGKDHEQYHFFKSDIY
jgi:hypothetical protein